MCHRSTGHLISNWKCGPKHITRITWNIMATNDQEWLSTGWINACTSLTLLVNCYQMTHFFFFIFVYFSFISVWDKISEWETERFWFQSVGFPFQFLSSLRFSKSSLNPYFINFSVYLIHRIMIFLSLLKHNFFQLLFIFCYRLKDFSQILTLFFQGTIFFYSLKYSKS